MVVVKGEGEAGEMTILFLTRILIGCHCLLENDDKFWTWPEQVDTTLSPDGTCQRNQGAWPAGAFRLWPLTSAQGLSEIYFPNKRPNKFLTLSKSVLAVWASKGEARAQIHSWFEMTSFHKYIFSAPCLRPWSMPGKIEMTQRWVSRGCCPQLVRGGIDVNKCQDVENVNGLKGDSNKVHGEFRRRRYDLVDLKKTSQEQSV